MLSHPHLHAHDGGSLNDEFNQNVIAVSAYDLLIVNAKALMPTALAGIVNDVFACPFHLSLCSKPLSQRSRN
jgi:hypothetical protein